MWQFFKSVFAGKDHIDENMPCQDYADYTISDSGVYIAALADGASAAVYSNIAASCNVNSVINVFHRLSFDEAYKMNQETLKKTIIDCCLSSIFCNIKRIPAASPIDFAATLLFLVSDGNKAIVGHVGDGIICAINNYQEVKMISSPQNVCGETNKTYFTVTKNAESYLSIYYIDNINDYLAFVLMSDGPETSFYDYTSRQIRSNNLLTIVNDIGKEWDREIELTYFLKSNFWEHGITGDDCSMVVFIRNPDDE